MRLNYYEELKKQLQDTRLDSEDFENTILFLPDIFNLLCDLLDEEQLIQEDRMIANCGISYLVVPSDVLPEDVYGVKGFMDDLFVCCVVLKELNGKYPDLIRKHWNNTVDDAEFDKVVDRCYYKSSQVIDEENLRDKILRYAGLAP